MSSIRLALTPQQEALPRPWMIFRWETGPTAASDILAMPKETFRSLCYRRRRPAAWMMMALTRHCNISEYEGATELECQDLGIYAAF